MKDTADTVTADLLPTPKKRGRPATGKAMTAAERKRAQRQRQTKLAYANDVSNAPVSALLGELGPAITHGYITTVKKICAELMRRAAENEKP